MTSRALLMVLALVAVGCHRPTPRATTEPAAPPRPGLPVLERGREPRALLALRPAAGTEDEVEVAYHSETLSGDARQVQDARFRLNARVGKVGGGAIEGDLLLGTDATAIASGTFLVSGGGLEHVELRPDDPTAQLSAQATQALALMWPLALPHQPVGAGARWRIEDNATLAAFGVKGVVTCELLAFDGQRGRMRATGEVEAAEGTVQGVTVRGLRLRLEQEIEIDGSRSLSPSRSHLVVEADLPEHVRYELAMTVTRPGADHLGMLPRDVSLDADGATAWTEPCRTLRGTLDGAVAVPLSRGGERLTGTCRNARAEGRWTWWFPDGKPQLEGTYAGGLPDGPWRQYDASGRLLGEVRFTAGTGVVAQVDGLGRRAESAFRAGVQEGRYAAWHAGGARALEGQFEDGRATGVWTAWDEGGAVVRREERDPRCLTVDRVVESGPAALGGIVAGDHLEAAGGKELASAAALVEALHAAAGQRLELRARRDGQARNVSVAVSSDGLVGVALVCCRVELPAGAACGP